MSVHSTRFLLAIILTTCGWATVLEAVPAILVPQPKQVDLSREAPMALEPGRTAIVLGDGAGEPERQAAQLLRHRVGLRFGQDWPVVDENSIPHQATTLVLLGQRSTHRLLDAICTRQNTVLDAQSPGHDGYIISFARQGDRRVVLVGGSNARGVIYGQDTLFQLIDKQNDKVVLHQATIRDWPSIPWRGRPQTHYRQYLEPGAMDCYMTSRINWIDLREGIYAFDADSELEKDVLARVITEAHARDMVVYGTVDCGVPAAKHEGVLRMFREFIDLGVDGLWISFDDKGPGEQPETLIKRTLDLARAHGISGDRIAVCPPKGSYQEIDTEFNRKIAAIPGMQQAMIFWTRVPGADDLAAAADIGLQRKPSWWHNWTRPASGLTHIEGGSLNAGNQRSYMPVPTMAEGWHAPSYDQLSDAAQFCDSVMPWGGQGWGQYYIVPVIGWWGWAPENHDFDATRRRIYDIVYGPDNVEAMFEFDDGLDEVKQLFDYPVGGSEWLPLRPAWLARLEDRSEVLRRLERLKRIASGIASSGAGGSLLTEDQLEEWYISAMQNEIAVGRAEATTDYPEYWWDAHQREVLDAVYDEDWAQADAAIERVRPRLLEEVAKIEKSLAGLKPVAQYVQWWRKQANMDAREWRQRLDARRKELTERTGWYAYSVATLSDMLGNVDSPPLGHGTGRWQRQNLLLATALPEAREQYWSDWIGGLHGKEEPKAAVFAFRHRTESLPGGYCELPVSLPLSGDRDRLGLMVYLSNVNKDSVGLHYVPRRWAGFKRIRLLHGNDVVWEADLGVTRRKGEWFVVRLPELPAELEALDLTLRVEDVKQARSYAIVYVGPIHLVQLPE